MRIITGPAVQFGLDLSYPIGISTISSLPSRASPLVVCDLVSHFEPVDAALDGVALPVVKRAERGRSATPAAPVLAVTDLVGLLRNRATHRPGGVLMRPGDRGVHAHLPGDQARRIGPCLQTGDDPGPYVINEYHRAA
jgi:hypothetical protein